MFTYNECQEMIEALRERQASIRADINEHYFETTAGQKREQEIQCKRISDLIGKIRTLQQSA